jgi:di/tricarboxylate transporter
VPAGCALVDMPLNQCDIGAELGVTVVAIWRSGQAVLTPEPTEVIHQDDYLLIMGREERVTELHRWGLNVGRTNGYLSADHDYSVDLTEIVIPPHAPVLGKTLKDLGFRNKYGLTVVALWRAGRSYRTDVGAMALRAGDALLMVGAREKIDLVAGDDSFVILESSHVQQPSRPEKAPWALAMMGVVLVGAVVQTVPLALTVLIGWLGLVYSRTLTMNEAYQAIEWRVIFLVAGMLPISIAMVNTGLATRLGDLLVNNLTPLGPLALVAGLYGMAVLITQVVGGQVTSLIVGPIAITAAVQAGVDPRAVAVATAIGCATGFLTPVAHPVNVLMLGPGGYTFGDFTRVGAGLTLVTFVMMLVMMHFLWGVG